MIVSGWISSLSTNTSVVFNDYVAETAQPDGAGNRRPGDRRAEPVSARRVWDPSTGMRLAYVRAYGTSSQPYVDVPANAANNAYYVYGSTFVLFRLSVEFAYAYSYAMTIPLGGFEGQARIVHRNFLLHCPKDGLSARFGLDLRAEGSRIDVAGILQRSIAHVSAHHGLPSGAVLTREIDPDALAFTPPVRKPLP